MPKYDIHKNKRNNYHPSIEVEEKDDGTWLNYEITSSPRKGETYVPLNKNPNRLEDPNKPALVRKYLRKDKVRHRGPKLKHYELYEEDKDLVDKLLNERESNIEKQNKNGVKRLNHNNGNQANRHLRAGPPSKTIKTHHIRRHKKKDNKTIR